MTAIILLLVISPLLVSSWISLGVLSTVSCRRSLHKSFLSGPVENKHQDDKNDNNQPNKRLLVFGLGNIGALVAKIGSNCNGTSSFERVYGTTRGGDKDVASVHVVQFDSYEYIREIIPSCTHVLVTIPPVDENTANASFVGGRPRKWNYFCDPVLNNPVICLKDIALSNTWVGYVSSTSVYGDHGGDWVYEHSDAKCKPGTKGALYLRAENEWREAAKSYGWRLHVFRCAGLYGDGRSALHTIQKGGVAQEIKSSASKVGNPTSRIHEEDAARAILSAMTYNEAYDGVQLWNLADDNPAPRSEVMAFGRKLLASFNLLPSQKSHPLSERRPPSERDKRRKSDNKRVANKLLKERLLPDGLLFPTYREGLKAVLKVNEDKWR